MSVLPTDWSPDYSTLTSGVPPTNLLHCKLDSGPPLIVTDALHNPRGPFDVPTQDPRISSYRAGVR